MSKRVKRGFFGYLMIFLGIALACLAVCVVVMIFKPGLKVFGISYFSEKEEREIKTADLYNNNEPVLDANNKVKTVDIYTNNNGNVTVLDYETIEINSNVFDVEFYSRPETESPGFENATTIVVKSSTTGFVKDGIRELTYSVKYFEDERKFQLNIEAPVGFINFSNSSKIYVKFPENSNVKLVANTQKGSITLGGTGTGATMLTAKSINLATTSGNISTTENFNLSGSLYDSSINYDSAIKTDSGNVNFSRPIICNNFNLTTKTGEMNFENEQFSVSNEFNFTAENSFLHLNNLTASNINFASKSGKVYAKTLDGDVDFTTETENCHFQVENVDGKLQIGTKHEDKISTRTKVNISGYVSDSCNIFTLGEINIGEIKSATIITGQDADITIKKVSGTLILDSKSSKITLGKITDENGNFLTSGIERKIFINCTEKSNIELYFRSVVDGSSVKTEKGNIYANCAGVSGGFIIEAHAENITHNGEVKENPYYLMHGNTNILTLTAKEKLEIITA